MRQYGAFKATEFSKKQIGVIYYKAKSGELQVEKWYMSRLYDLADFYGYDDNRSIEMEESYILDILEAVFSGNIAEAQQLICKQEESVFSLTSKRYSKNFNRNCVA